MQAGNVIPIADPGWLRGQLEAVHPDPPLRRTARRIDANLPPGPTARSLALLSLRGTRTQVENSPPTLRVAEPARLHRWPFLRVIKTVPEAELAASAPHAWPLSRTFPRGFTVRNAAERVSPWQEVAVDVAVWEPAAGAARPSPISAARSGNETARLSRTGPIGHRIGSYGQEWTNRQLLGRMSERCCELRRSGLG